MPIFDDSGVSFPNEAATAYPKFTSPMIERWNEMQLATEPAQSPKSMSVEEVANEIFSRLMTIGTNKDASKAEKTAALEGAWRVYADYARLLSGD